MAEDAVDDDDISLFEQEATDVLSIGELRFRQYNDDRWGIHSWVWDGGIALLKYVMENWLKDGTSHGEKSVVIDLGSGTGVTGYGIAWYSQGNASVVVTDLKEALPLLQENFELNNFARFSERAPVIQELQWGDDVDEDSLWHIVQGSQRVLITGADIVYRPSLFEPLLLTLEKLDEMLRRWNVGNFDIWFACQSVRTHLDEFWETAAKHGFTSKLLATVQLGKKKTELSQIQIAFSESKELSSNYIQKADGIVLIVSLSKCCDGGQEPLK